MATKTIADIDLSGKKVLMRVDFNVPVAEGKVTNDKRIQAALPSIKHALDAGAALILISHLGRPDGQVKPEFSLKPAADRLAEILGKEVKLGPQDVAGDEAQKMAADLNAGEILVLENIRFDPREKSKDESENNALARQLAKMGDVYVNDAFGTCHRKHASMYALPQAVKAAGGPAVAGFLVEKEIKYLGEALANPARPFVAILGGAKVSDKIKLISTLLEKVDRILIGGAMAYTLLKAKGTPVGKSRVEEDQVDTMKPILKQAGDKIVLPADHVVTDDFDSGKPTTTECDDIPSELMGMDIGPRTVQQFEEIIKTAKTIAWNGPMGVFEKQDYANGTAAIGWAVKNATEAGAVSIIGGGDSAAAVEQMGLAEEMTHVSTGGGASLTFMEGKPMPPIEILEAK